MKDDVRRADPATFEIIKNSLYKIAEEMRVVLAKTAYSPLLKSAGDYSCGVFDAQGEMVAQGPDLPIHLGSMPDAVRAVVAAFASDVHDGRKHLNFSEWGNYDAKQREEVLEKICEQIQQGEMPDKQYALIHRDAKLKQSEKDAICKWTEAARQY